MGRELEILNAMFAFQERITVPVAGNSTNIIDDILELDPRVVCYLTQLSVSTAFIGASAHLVISAQYHNKEVLIGDIHVTESELEICSILCQSIGNYKKKIIILSQSESKVEAAYERFMVTNAPFFANFIGSNISKAKTSMTSFFIYSFDFSYRIGKVKLSIMESQTAGEVKRLSKVLFIYGMPEPAKVYLAHNYLATSIKYTLKRDASILEKSYIQSAYGALVNKQCVCQGFAEAFKRLMDAANVDCDVVCGQIAGSAEYHAWNIVKLQHGNGNYHIDVTWDSNQPRLIYDYFGKNDAFFTGKRIWNKKYTVPCNGSFNILAEAKRYVGVNKGKLLGNGVSLTVLDV